MATAKVFSATALFDYEAEAADELTLRVGDKLSDIKQIEEGWCQGSLNGKTGMFPDNFVKMEEVVPSPKPTGKKKKAPELRKMKVTFSYDPQGEDELKMAAGDIIEVLKDLEEGWAEGRLNGRQGAFPTNFCVPFVNEAPSPSEEKAEEPSNQIPAKKVKGVGFGNIFGEGPIKLKKSSFGESEADKSAAQKATATKAAAQKAMEPKTQATVKEKSDKPPPLPSLAAKKAKTVEKCRVTYDYDATNEDELTMRKGDIVIILDKNCADAGWWEGEIVDDDGRKRKGLFPDNFVEILPPEDEIEEKTSTKDPGDLKPVEDKAKNKKAEQEPAKSKPSQILKESNSLKRPAPQVPPLPTKPTAEETNDISAADTSAVVNSSSLEEPQLTHYKRAAGPKNRRKPDTTGRRERAKETTEDPGVNDSAESIDIEPETKESEPVATEPNITPKRETIRGIQVMPSPGSGGASEGGDTPSWLKNLKNRSSQKRTEPAPLVVSPNKPEEKEAAPDWLSNLRKKSKSEKPVPSAAPKPVPAATSPKPGNQPAPAKAAATSSPATNHHPPVRPPSPVLDDKNDKQWSFKKSMKSKSESDVLATASAEIPTEAKPEPKPEAKRPPLKPHVALQPPKQLELPGKKPVAAAKPKPPPPKAKPALPGAKPVPVTSSIEELKDEMKSLKESFANMQSENKKEMDRLHRELEEEKKQRIALQGEIAQLRKQIG